MAIRVLCPNDGKDEAAAGGLWETEWAQDLPFPALEAQGKGKKKKVPNGRRLTEDERCWRTCGQMRLWKADVLCEMDRNGPTGCCPGKFQPEGITCLSQAVHGRIERMVIPDNTRGP